MTESKPPSETRSGEAFDDPQDRTSEFLPAVSDQTMIPEGGIPSGGSDPFCPQQIGSYKIVRRLGEGGMGAVYEGRTPGTGAAVAIKVLSRWAFQQPQAKERFHKEVRLLREVNNPYVANLIESGEEGGEPYLAMEFIAGRDLKQVLTERQKFDERTALRITADICRALLPAHAVGIIHRDIKPANVLVPSEEFGSPGKSGVRGPLVKLTDFGLARHIDQTESLQLTQTGSLLGTPYYMAPEQLTGKGDLTPAVDVYALGVTLFELLSGRRPFEAEDHIKLAGLHCFTAPPALRKLVPELSEGAVGIVEKALAKEPHARQMDAARLLLEIERLLRGETEGGAKKSLLPPHDPANIVAGEFEWDLDSSPEALWPYVCNTERVNQAIGLPGVNYQLVREPGKQERRLAKARLSGIPLSWEEHPYEWIEGRRMSILREFDRGPFKWFLSTVTLAPRANGGTTLRQSLQIEPRGWLGKIVAKGEIGAKGRKALDRVYQRIDQTLRGRPEAAAVADAFQEIREVSGGAQRRLKQRVDKLGEEGVSPRFQAAIRQLLSKAAAQDLARVRPNPLAKRFRLSSQEALEGCLRGVKQGLLTMHWDILCPTCRISSEVRDTLKELQEHAHCEACDLDFGIDFGKSLELIFRVHPEIRKADLKTYCIGGPSHFPHAVAQVRITPGERTELNLNLGAGGYLLRAPQLAYTIPLLVENGQGTTHAELQLTKEFDARQVPLLKAGGQSLAITNEEFETDVLLRVERTTLADEAVTAAEAATSSLFRELFPEQVLSPGLLVHGAVHGFLSADVTNLERLYRDLGDSATFGILRNFRKKLESCVPAHRGTVVELTEEHLLAVFAGGQEAVEAGWKLATLLEQTTETKALEIQWGAHAGPTLVATDQQAIRYFGREVQRVRKLSRLSEPGAMLISRELASDPQVGELLRERNARVLPPPEEAAQTEEGSQLLTLSQR